MENHKYHIVWQKWADPLGEDDLYDDDRLQTTSENIDPEFYDDDGESIVGDQELLDESIQFYKRPTRMIMTPMGMIPYTDNTASNKIFNLWVGHTNFNLTSDISKIIESFDGIETLDIFTRYRFRIGIGKLFKSSDIMSQLTDSIYQYLSNLENNSNE